MTDNIKFHYFSDPNDSRRVLTVASRKLEQDKFEISYAINFVKDTTHTFIKQEPKDENGFPGLILESEQFISVYDKFNKKIARKLTLDRLNNHSNTLVIEAKNSVKLGICEALKKLKAAPGPVKSIATKTVVNINLINRMNSEYNDYDCEIGSYNDGRGMD